jgi:hypothetical protein
VGTGPDAAFVWKSSRESIVTARDGEDCEERLNGDDWARRRLRLTGGMSGRGLSDTYVIADSKPWKAGCGVETDLEQRLEGTLWLEGGSESAWWTYGMGVDVYGRDEGNVAGGEEARGGNEIKRERKGTG